MRIFVAYRHTGESPDALKAMLTPVCDVLRELGLDPYCSFYEEDMFQDREYNPGDIMAHAFARLADCGALFVLQHSSSHSEGMLLEVGYCLGTHKPVIVAPGPEAKSYLPDLHPVGVARWETIEQLVMNLKTAPVRSHLADMQAQLLLDESARKRNAARVAWLAADAVSHPLPG